MRLTSLILSLYKNGSLESRISSCKDLTALIKQREELEPEETRRKKEAATLRRFLSILKSLKRDIEFLKNISGFYRSMV
ncbi:MAG: hypothetical protein U9R43_12770 [Thermodesulfobacteriota bacterium]|nr:hypothetical protein [Thermodesulfobacteriota bacterium]